MYFTFFLILTLSSYNGFCNEEGELLRWNILTYKDPPRQDTYQISGMNYYIPGNNIPTGLTPYRTKIFITVPRINLGIPSTLNYIDLTKVTVKDEKSPALRSYPSYDVNELYPDLHSNLSRIISVYRTRLDERCNRLWFVDTGTIETATPTVVQKPSIWVINLFNDETIQRFEIPSTIPNMATGFVSITVDIKLSCDDAYAYLPNSKTNELFVYSLKENKIWAFADPSMTPETTFSLNMLTISGNPVTINAGIYSVALGSKSVNGSRTVYYHSLASYTESSVSNTVLKNVALSGTVATSTTDFKFTGLIGDKAQSGIHDIDERYKVMFFTQLQKNSIICWNTENTLNPLNTAVVLQNDATLIYPVDLKIDSIGYLYYMSNKMPLVSSPKVVDKTQLNFFIARRNVRRLIADTVCDNPTLRNLNIDGTDLEDHDLIDETDVQDDYEGKFLDKTIKADQTVAGGSFIRH